jgi:hypothetical protein
MILFQIFVKNIFFDLPSNLERIRLSVVTAIILFASIAGSSIDSIKMSRLPNDNPGIGNGDMMKGYSYIRNNTAPDALIIN